ncbi:uncharacterized protein WCC33_001304 [Rhinophrynus dorsalis]
MQMDQRQVYEHLYNSMMMNKDKDHVNEKILNLTLEIIFLLTGEVPVRCEDVAVYLSVEEWAYLEEHKEHYKEVMRENPQPIGSQDCENENPEKDNGSVSDSELSVTDHQDSQETIHPDTCADESGRNTPETHPLIDSTVQTSPHPHRCKEEDEGITQDYQMDPGAVFLPQQCKEEDIPTDISTDESSNRNTPERLPMSPYPQDCTEEDNGITQEYQMEPGAVFLSRPCKEEIPTDIGTDESSNRNTPERRPISPYPQDRTEEDNGFTQEWQIEPEAVIFPQPCKEREIPTDISTDESSNRNPPERRPIRPYTQVCTEEDNRITQDYQMESGDVIVPQQCKEEEIPTEISTGKVIATMLQSRKPVSSKDITGFGSFSTSGVLKEAPACGPFGFK